MYDSCVLFSPDKEIENRFMLKFGDAKVIDEIKREKGITFFRPKTKKELNSAVNRMVPYGIIDAELIYEKDSLHYVKAGIDDGIAKAMAEKKIAVVFDLSLLLKTRGIERARILSRMRENMRRVVKYNIPVLFASLATDIYGLFNGGQIKAIAHYLSIDNFDRVKVSFEKIFGD